MPRVTKDKTRFLARGQWVITVQRLCDELELSRDIVEFHWGKSCPYFENKPIIFWLEKPPGFNERIKVCPESLIDELRAKFAEVAEGRLSVKDQTGKEIRAWLAPELTLLTLQIGTEQFSVATLRSWKPRRRHRGRNQKPGSRYRAANCPYLGGRCVTTKKFSFLAESRTKPGHFRNTSTHWYLEKDVMEIKEELIRQCAARGATSPRSLTGTSYTGVFENPKAFTLTPAEEEAGISRMTLWEYVRKGFPKTIAPFLIKDFPAGKLPATPRLVPGTKALMPLTILGEHLNLLNEGLNRAFQACKLEERQHTYRTADELLRHFGINGVQEELMVREFLNHQAEIGALMHMDTLRKFEGRRRYVAARIFVLDHLEQGLDGRALLDVAREFCASAALTDGAADDGANGAARADTEPISAADLPENYDVVALAKEIKKKPGLSHRQIAIDFTKGKVSRAESLLRQLRRHKHLLN